MYLPLYLAGIAGPALGAMLVAGGTGLVYQAGGTLLVACGAVVTRALLRARRS